MRKSEYRVMEGKFEQKLVQLGISLPATTSPSANYVPARRLGSQIYISGQVPSEGGKDKYTGKLGSDFSVEEGQAAARLCAINILAQLRQALDGNLDRVVGVVRLGGFVNAAPDFTDHPKVINGASNLMVEVFGEAGRHARAAVGCNSLPRNVPVEVDAIFEVS
jgi:enamine deaminase RidA (YjgF/YER057c/UK114 family)